MLVLVGAMHLAVLLLSCLFSYLALRGMHFRVRWGKVWAVLLFLVLLAGVGTGFGRFLRVAVKTLPEVADQTIPSVLQWASRHQIELPFTDYDSLKDAALDTVKGSTAYLAGFAKAARGAFHQVVFLVAGIIVAMGLFLNPRFALQRRGEPAPENLYTRCCDEIGTRFSRLFDSFAKVMGAQILISAINTVLTGLFALTVGLNHLLFVVGVTFLCGLLPVVGNLISNTIIVGIAFTVSPVVALAALVFLVVIHKLEYLLNSKIIGHRIRNPLWLTLLALVVGERLMGIAGIILAPVVLDYIRGEVSRFPAAANRPPREEGAESLDEAARL